VTDVAVLCRREEHATALNGRGLRVSGRHDFTAAVRAATRAADLPEADIVIVATKASDVSAAAATFSGHWPRAAVMTVQNGLGAEEAVRGHGDWPLVSAVTFMSGTRHADTHV